MPHNPPNVLFLMTDQHRYDLMTCASPEREAAQERVPTPNIDRIAADGVRFSDAYCPYPVCLASRSSLLTGLYPHHTGAIDNDDRLDWRYRTVAHHFGDAGYLTALIGKMHYNDAHNHGFAYYLSINDWLMYLGPKARHYADEIASHQLTDVFNRTVFDTGAGFPDVSDLWDGPSPWVGEVERYPFTTVTSKLNAEDHLDSFIARETIKFLQRYRDQRFFLLASFMKPHTPFFPPHPWSEMFPIDEMELPPVGDASGYPAHIQARIRTIQRVGPQRLRAQRAGYLGNLAFVDSCIGQVYDALHELGLAQNTIVVYTSDHGEMLGDHGLYQKFCLFEPAVRVPLIVAYPSQLPAGAVTGALTEYMGLYPTLAELAGLPAPTSTKVGAMSVDLPGAPHRLDATSFAGVLRDPEQEGPPAVFSEYNLRREPRYMVRTRRYKYILNEGAPDSRGPIDELYDLQEDPGELVNRIDDPALRGVQDDLRARLVSWYDPASNPDGTLDP
jgi:choline-sulfatase